MSIAEVTLLLSSGISNVLREIYFPVILDIIGEIIAKTI